MKEILTVLGVVIVIVGGILSLTFGLYAMSNTNEKNFLARTIQCKEVGGNFSYENYNWICK